jgi:selenocysteine lyase/cysteine desulfurase
MIPFASESKRIEEFPVARKQIFLAHAGVTALPRRVADAMRRHIEMSCENHQEFGDVLRDIARFRSLAAGLIGARAEEIALLGPTSLGLSLFANGLDWHEGDEIICYQDDYPANVYPWVNLARKGVKIRFLKPQVPGQITPELVAGAITPETRLVALASCHFLSGWRIDIDAIGHMLHEHGILFSLDAIQTLGAFPTPARHIDFLSADAHKWLLGPLAIGVVYVARRNFEICHPTLLGAWNVHSPNFLAQDAITYPDTAQRYEPGVLNVTGLYGMAAAIEMLLDGGIEEISRRILDVRDYLHARLETLDFESLSPPATEPLRSGILTMRHRTVESAALFRALELAGITASLRSSRDAGAWLRFSPHFYNTRDEMDRVVTVLEEAIARRAAA